MTTPSSPKPTTIALVTGATRGLGQETVRRLAALGWTVWLGARDLEQGTLVAKELAADGGDIRPVELDVTDTASVAVAAEVIAASHDHLDVLINNAGIVGPPNQALDVVAEDFLPTYDVNVLGPVRLIGAFLPLLRASDSPRIVNVSSGLGSITRATDPEHIESSVTSLIYTSSKSALNMVTTQYAKLLPQMRINVVDPGYTATDFNQHQGYQTVEEGTDAIVTMATAVDDATGTFVSRSGPVPW